MQNSYLAFLIKLSALVCLLFYYGNLVAAFTNVAPSLSSALNIYEASSAGHGPGTVFTDLNLDGYPDLVLVENRPRLGRWVYKNVNAGGGLRDFDAQQLLLGPGMLGDPFGATGAVAADYDNDGDIDLYILSHPGDLAVPSDTVSAPNQLWQNQLINLAEQKQSDFTFVDVTDSTDPTPNDPPAVDNQIGVAAGRWQGKLLSHSQTAAWADVNRDGYLDLYVGNHTGIANGSELEGQRDILYRNNGDGTFTDITMQANVPGFIDVNGESCVPSSSNGHQCYSSSNAVIFADLNNDRWPDLVVTNKMNNPDYDADMVYINRGFDQQNQWLGFHNITDLRDIPDINVFGRVSHNAMGIDAGDIDNDGDLDLYITDLDFESVGGGFQSNPGNDLWLNKLSETGALDFDVSSNFADQLLAQFSWGTQWLDSNNDGRLDLQVSAGYADTLINSVENGYRDYLYIWDGQGFSDQTTTQNVRNLAPQGASGNGFTDARSSVAGDFDQDGAMDYIVINTNDETIIDEHKSVLYLNNQTAGSGNAQYLHIALQGAPDDPNNPYPYRSSRDAVGARVELTTSDGVTQIREVISGSSNAASTASMDLEFGLGGAAAIDKLVVNWPSGQQSVLNGPVAMNQRLLINEDSVITQPAPLQVINPISQTAHTGTLAVFNCPVLGGIPGYSFQWESSTQPLNWRPLRDGGAISGANSDTLKVFPVSSLNEGWYRCRVTDSGQPVTVVTSLHARLNFEHAFGLSSVAFDTFNELTVDASLDGRALETGNQTWMSMYALQGVYNNASANTNKNTRAVVPLEISSGYNLLGVEASIDPSGSQWTAIGFTQDPLTNWWNTTGGQLWVLIRPNGKYTVYAMGTSINLTGGALPITDFRPGDYNHVQFFYDPIAKTISLWINGIKEISNLVLPVTFIEAIAHAGWSSRLGRMDDTRIDNFEVLRQVDINSKAAN